MVEVEASRGELPTDLTIKFQNIRRLEGAEKFCRLLSALGKDNFIRGYSFNSGLTKQETLSQLLKKCWPGPNDTASRLKVLLKKTDISDNRLVEAAMYAPQWAGLAEEITGWDGLKKAIWFFHAHVSEHFSAEKETEIAIYSPISPVQFNDGAFDPGWFEDVYQKLGEKRFDVLYKKRQIYHQWLNRSPACTTVFGCSSGQTGCHQNRGRNYQKTGPGKTPHICLNPSRERTRT